MRVAHRLRDVFALHLAVVDPVRALPDVRPVPARAAFQHRAADPGELADGPEAPPRQHLARARPHTPETLQRERGEEGGLAAFGHDHEAVWLAEVRADLGAQLVRRDADRDDETEAFSHRTLDLFGHRDRTTEQMLGRGHVEERLVQRDRLHQRRLLVKDRHDRIGRLEIAVEVAWHVDAIRTEPSRDRERHGRANAEGARLVGSRHDDPSLVRTIATDDDRLAAVLRMVPLLDRRVERVEVAVKDRARHANRTLTVVSSGARNWRSDSPSVSTATRSRTARRAKAEMRRTASFFARTRLHVPAANPSTMNTASTIAFFV